MGESQSWLGCCMLGVPVSSCARQWLCSCLYTPLLYSRWFSSFLFWMLTRQHIGAAGRVCIPYTESSVVGSLVQVVSQFCKCNTCIDNLTCISFSFQEKAKALGPARHGTPNPCNAYFSRCNHGRSARMDSLIAGRWMLHLALQQHAVACCLFAVTTFATTACVGCSRMGRCLVAKCAARESHVPLPLRSILQAQMKKGW